MSQLRFSDLSFTEHSDCVRVWFLRIFYFDLSKKTLTSIGHYKLSTHSIEFPRLSEAKTNKKFSAALNQGFQSLRNSLTDKPTIYVHKNSHIPLIGNVGFGITDRNSTLIEAKPITGCNLDCIHCSVDENKRSFDFVVEKDYLVEELRKLVESKETDGLEIHINAQGEPLYYSPLDDLISDISKWPEIRAISLNTNAALLTEKRVDALLKAGLTQFNISLNALDPKLASRIAGKPYPLQRVKRVCAYIAKKSTLRLAPVWIPGVNDCEISKLVSYAKSLKAKIGVQNFLVYRYGKRPAKPYTMRHFFDLLRALEEESGTKLILDAEDFSIRPTRKLPKPFTKGQKIQVDVVCPGRMANEKTAVCKDRNITVSNCYRNGRIWVKITRDKHNIFYAVPS